MIEVWFRYFVWRKNKKIIEQYKEQLSIPGVWSIETSSQVIEVSSTSNIFDEIIKNLKELSNPPGKYLKYSNVKSYAGYRKYKYCLARKAIGASIWKIKVIKQCPYDEGMKGEEIEYAIKNKALIWNPNAEQKKIIEKSSKLKKEWPYRR